jgi:hypothetical protein
LPRELFLGQAQARAQPLNPLGRIGVATHAESLWRSPVRGEADGRPRPVVMSHRSGGGGQPFSEPERPATILRADRRVPRAASFMSIVVDNVL